MAHTQSLSLRPRNAHSSPFIELRRSLPSRVAVISPCVDQLMRFILKLRSADGAGADIEMALHEALANDVIHGNDGNSHGRGTYLIKTLTDEVCFEEGGAVVIMRKNSDANSAERRKP